MTRNFRAQRLPTRNKYLDRLPHEKQIADFEETIAQFRKQNGDDPLFADEVESLEEKLSQLKEKVHVNLSPWERVSICRHPARPHTIDYIHAICDDFFELCGDRTYREDHAIIGGLARIGGEKFIVMGQEKGNDTETRVHHNFGMLSPEGFRKALRLVKLAEKFHLPVVSLLDTPGAFPGLEAEERGQGWAIALNLREMARAKTPIIVIVIGEGCSGGALGMGVGDVIGMLEHAYYSVISPEGCASILWKDPTKNVAAASTLRLNAENLLELGVIDEVIKEAPGGAHHEPSIAFQNVKEFIVLQAKKLAQVPADRLLENRYNKFRGMGAITSKIGIKD
jgi:acetyl-CoA carboxylase carboxyl transferase subunit alpha